MNFNEVSQPGVRGTLGFVTQRYGCRQMLNSRSFAGIPNLNGFGVLGDMRLCSNNRCRVVKFSLSKNGAVKQKKVAALNIRI